MNPVTPEATIPFEQKTETRGVRAAEEPIHCVGTLSSEENVAVRPEGRSKSLRECWRRLSSKWAKTTQPQHPEVGSDSDAPSTRMWSFFGFSMTWAVSPGRLWGRESESGPCRVLFEASVIDHHGDRSQRVLRLILGRLAIWVTRA